MIFHRAPGSSSEAKLDFQPQRNLQSLAFVLAAEGLEPLRSSDRRSPLPAA